MCIGPYHNYDDIVVLIDDPTDDCLHAGQGGRIWRQNYDGSLYVELNCGHPTTIPMSMIGDAIKLRSDLIDLIAPEDILMPTKTTDDGNNGNPTILPNALSTTPPPPVAAAPKKVKGPTSVPVAGLEAMVGELASKQQTIDWLKAEVDLLKSQFRKQAHTAALTAPVGTSSFSFESGGAYSIQVALMNGEMAGNRVEATAKKITDFEKKGLDLSAYLETVVSYELRGEFVQWLANLLAQWESADQAIPDGLTKKSVTRLSAAGVQSLTKMHRGKDKNPVAGEALRSLIKTPSVKVKVPK